MGQHHSAAAAKVTPQTKTRRRQYASAPAAKDTMGIETRNMPCHSSAAAKDNVPATKGIPLVAVPFQCLDDSGIENRVTNDVCRPKVSGSSRARNEHPLVTNGSSLEKSVADSEETQILGTCFPPGFSKSNIRKPVRSGRCASSAAAKDNVPATKGIPLVAVPIPCLDDSSIENNVSNDVCRPKVSGSSRAWDEHPSISNGSSLKKSVADSEETQLGACFPPGFSKSNIGKPVRSGRCASSASAKDNVPATKGIPLMAVSIPCLDDSSIENNVSNDVCRPKVSGSSRARDEHPLVTNGSSLEKSIADSEETQILGTCFPPGFSKSNIGKPVRSGRCASSAAAKDNVPATKGIPLVAVPIPCLDDSSIENNVSNDVCRTKVSGSSRARDEHPLITNGSSLKKSIADSEETQLGACFPPGFSKSNIGKPVRSGRCASSASAKENVPATKGIPLVAVPIPYLDDSSIENNVSNDVCRPKVSGSSRARDEHPLITNGSSLKKSVADSEETQLGVCFPPGFSKSNIGKPVRSGRCARSAPRAIRKTVGSTRKFTGKSSAHTSDDAQDPIRTTCSNMTAFGKDGFENVTINEIMRALSCQASVSRGVLTFEAKRFDGKVVRVTNDFLKANNPFLLLNFYDTYFRNTPEAAGMLGSGNRY
nr:chromo domain protein LHP1-like [Ipomoea batatas]